VVEEAPQRDLLGAREVVRGDLPRHQPGVDRLVEGEPALFDEAQRIFAQELPIVRFAAPRIYTAVGRRVENATPALLRPMLLWNPDRLTVRNSRAGAR